MSEQVTVDVPLSTIQLWRSRYRVLNEAANVIIDENSKELLKGLADAYWQCANEALPENEDD